LEEQFYTSQFLEIRVTQVFSDALSKDQVLSAQTKSRIIS